MTRACILTDNSVVFPTQDFPGLNLVNILPLNFQTNRIKKLSLFNSAASQTANHSREFPVTTISPPNKEVIRALVSHLSQAYSEILVITLAENLVPVGESIQESMASLGLPSHISYINSQNISLGLGWIVQKTAALLDNGKPVTEIKRLLQNLVPHIYTIIFISDLMALQSIHRLELEQSLVGEMLGIKPVVLIESGKLVPYRKIRTSKQKLDLMIEFLGEINRVDFVGVIHGTNTSQNEITSLRCRIISQLPSVPLAVHGEDDLLDCMFGAEFLGITIIEKTGT